jgi:hypothetical protein
MSLTDKIKNLIADGKTQQAVDMLQTFLQEKSGGDHQLLNQTLLLEGQYKELQKKVQLGLEDASGDMNRINFSLLNLCDEAEGLVTEAGKKAEIAADTEGTKNLSMNPLIIFAVIAAVAILTVVGLLFLNKNTSKASIGHVTEPTETQPLVKPQIVIPKNWSALEPVLTVTDRYYGDYKITIKGIKAENLDAEHDRLTINMNLNCLKSISGKCLGNYVKFRLTTAPNTELEPESDRAFDNQSDKTTREETVSFIVPKSIGSGILDVFYVDKPKSKATTKIIGN